MLSNSVTTLPQRLTHSSLTTLYRTYAVEELEDFIW